MSHAEAAFTKATGDRFADVEQAYFDTAPESFAPLDIVTPPTVSAEGGGWDIISEFDCEQIDTEGYNDEMWRRVRIEVTSPGLHVLVVTWPATATISLRRTDDLQIGEPSPRSPWWPIGDDWFEPPDVWLSNVPVETWLGGGVYDVEVHVPGVSPTQGCGANSSATRINLGVALMLTRFGSRIWLVVTLAFGCQQERVPVRLATVEGGPCSSQSRPQCSGSDSMLMCVDRAWIEMGCGGVCAIDGLLSSVEGCVTDEQHGSCVCRTTDDSCADSNANCVSGELIEVCVDGELDTVDCTDVCADLNPPRNSLGCDNAGWVSDGTCTLEATTCDAAQPTRCGPGVSRKLCRRRLGY